MGEHFVEIVADEQLPAEPGWVMAVHEPTGDVYLIIRESRCLDPQALEDAWDVARSIENDALAGELRGVTEGERRSGSGSDLGVRE
jgi:hypothetical protein